MLLDDADDSRVPAQLRNELRFEAFNPKLLAARQLVGILLYLVSLGLVAASTIGAFFGTGFSLLMHHTGEIFPGSGTSDPGSSINASSPEARGHHRFVTGRPAHASENDLEGKAGGSPEDRRDRVVEYLSVAAPQLVLGTDLIGVADKDQFVIAPSIKSMVGAEQLSLAVPALRTDHRGIERHLPALSFEPGTLRLAGHVERSRPRQHESFDLAGQQVVTQSAQLVPTRELRPRRQLESRTRRHLVPGLEPAAPKRKSTSQNARSSSKAAALAR
jgi:hypothetical protein